MRKKASIEITEMKIDFIKNRINGLRVGFGWAVET